MNIDPDQNDELFCDTCRHRGVTAWCDECWPSMYEDKNERSELLKMANDFLRLMIAGAAAQAVNKALEEHERKGDHD